MLSIIKKVIQYPFTAWIWVYTVFAFVSHRLIAMCVARFYRDPERGVVLTSLPFLRLGFKLIGIRLVVKGLEHIPKEENFILASNHQSLIDVVAYMISVPRKFVFFAKKELKKVPLLGWEIQNMGYWFVDRDDPRVALKQMEEVRKGIETDKPLLVFPEGTRSKDETLGDFKRGTFMLAVQTGVPVLPCRIKGAYKVLGKKSLLLWPGKVTLHIGKPIPVKKIDDKAEQKVDAVKLMNRVRAEMEALGD